ncbi:hypothetical protein SLA2020_235180 [Shorea laevis]
MPPEVPHSCPLLTPPVQFSTLASPSSPKSSRRNRRMRAPGKMLIPVLILVLSGLSIVRLAKIAFNTWSPPQVFTLLPSSQNNCSSPSACKEGPSITRRPPKPSATETALTTKEFLLLSNLITQKLPCNLLVFGLEPQYLNLAALNAGGITLFLEDNPDKISEIKENSNVTRVYKVEYKTAAKKAYKLLKQARQNSACAPSSRPLQQETCKLALRNLPPQVYETKWDVVVVDGPAGDGPEAPGRMATIYTAGLLARAGNTTDVLVHDVDRTIEKWFSWEFLCEENLVCAKGRLWTFRITGQSNSNRFCSGETVEII